ncbi:hypothetical protein M9458_008899, partial [Cirrhinus mrigala]
PTQDPEPSQPSPRHAEYEPEPTADEEPEPRATEPEPDTSDQVREPATTFVTVEAMESPAHCTTAGGELEENSGDLIDFSMETSLLNYLPVMIILSAWNSHPPTLFCLHPCPRPSDPAAPPRLSAPSSPPSPVGPPARQLHRAPSLLLLRVPPVSSLAPPTFIAPLDSVDSGFCPPSGVL